MPAQGSNIDRRERSLRKTHIPLDKNEPCLDEILFNNNPIIPTPIRCPLKRINIDPLIIDHGPWQDLTDILPLPENQHSGTRGNQSAFTLNHKSPFSQKIDIRQSLMPPRLYFVEDTTVPAYASLIKECLGI